LAITNIESGTTRGGGRRPATVESQRDHTDNSQRTPCQRIGFKAKASGPRFSDSEFRV